ncbi:FmdB family zinc ribbon protein [Deinococcus alpinitundrae]|uniref:FmdB family zinc ribbon protein n=1 Tax=Deinococcus alpinitundrae TaxID=468913 RepID=UPI00137ADEEA|nr:FmdB family zinc ribbon protein [Deinococcus alpinitundrae]
MPTYVYRNLVTQEIFEVKQSMKDAAFTQHPETGEPVKRLVSAPAIAFKGSGFYANDSRAASKVSSSTSTAESGKTESGKTEAGSGADSASTATPAATPTPKVETPKTAEKSSPAKSTATSGGTGQ